MPIDKVYPFAETGKAFEHVEVDWHLGADRIGDGEMEEGDRGKLDQEGGVALSSTYAMLPI